MVNTAEYYENMCSCKMNVSDSKHKVCLTRWGLSQLVTLRLLLCLPSGQQWGGGMLWGDIKPKEETYILFIEN